MTDDLPRWRTAAVLQCWLVLLPMRRGCSLRHRGPTWDRPFHRWVRADYRIISHVLRRNSSNNTTIYKSFIHRKLVAYTHIHTQKKQKTNLNKVNKRMLACECELIWLDKSVNFSESCCLRIGARCDISVAGVNSLSGKSLPWVIEMRYLGVFIVRSRSMKCSRCNACWMPPLVWSAVHISSTVVCRDSYMSKCTGAGRVQARSHGVQLSAQPSTVAPQYLVDLCQSVSSVACRQHLRSANRGLLVVPRYRLSSYGRRAFSVAGPAIRNWLPDSMQRDPAISRDSFRRSLKTFLFSAYLCT